MVCHRGLNILIVEMAHKELRAQRRVGSLQGRIVAHEQAYLMVLFLLLHARQSITPYHAAHALAQQDILLLANLVGVYPIITPSSTALLFCSLSVPFFQSI